MANRGASGIDGLVSTALGVSIAGLGPVVALLGDLSFLHDAGAVLWNASRGFTLTTVVVNNGGGHVFSLLPQLDLPEHRDLFLTPHGVDIPGLCRAAGAGHERVERSSDLLPALDRAAGAGGLRVVEVVVDAELGLRRRHELREAVDAALARS
jgi:2-succinyl-5-enolpyruvyl-6-hydroxy-3-cyclohexene-1-carboxylate synthase